MICKWKKGKKIERKILEGFSDSYELPAKAEHGVKRELAVLLEEDLPNVGAVSGKHDEAMFDLLDLVSSRPDENRHAQRLQLVVLLVQVDTLLLCHAQVEMHFDEQRSVLLRLLEVERNCEINTGRCQEAPNLQF